MSDTLERPLRGRKTNSTLYSSHKELMRKLTFAAVGGSGVLLSFVILWLGIDILGLDHWVAYLAQTAIVIEYNFLLSRFLTWRDRRDKVSFWSSWVKFHGARMLLTIPLNQALFSLLTVAFGWHYLLANVTCITAATVINYIISDKFIFKTKETSQQAPRQQEKNYYGTIASFIIPVKGNEDTIRQTVESIDALQWDGAKEVIIVGSHDDTTWGVIKDYVQSGLVKTYEVHVERQPGRRDANAKRHFGLKHASGEILAVIDSDVILPVDWLLTVASHFNDGHSAVGGPVAGLKGGFWTRYIDQNPVASKTPRIKGVTLINSLSIRYKKPPVTANFACTRDLYKDTRVGGGPNMSFRNSYEDYEWFSRIVRAEYAIVRDEKLSATRYHREGFRPLLREYTRSGKGCADHMVTHPSCGFAQTRGAQLTLIAVTAAVVCACLALRPLWTLAGLATVYIAYTAACILRVRRLEAVVYPLLSVVFTSAFIYGNISRFVRHGFRKPAHPSVEGFRFVSQEES